MVGLLTLPSMRLLLLPKMDNVVSIGDYRPISLCNVLYKLIAKVLANRLKMVLPSIISHHQSAFVPGRLITDNVLFAYEALHTMNSRMRGKKDYMAVKVVMRKAYDRVEWPFLEAMLRTMAFAERWITLIVTCVKSVSYSVLINGKPCGKIVPSHGLRQGDPLSPYLFLIMAEGLSSLIAKAERHKLITEVPIAVWGFHLSHLFFADNSLLFCRANFTEWSNLFQVLHLYEKASGQQLNTAKTQSFLSKTPELDFGSLFAALLGFQLHQVLIAILVSLPWWVGPSLKPLLEFVVV
jgi:hypothetical protein